MGAIWQQKQIQLPSLSRGAHLIEDHITSSLSDEIKSIKCGLLHLFLQHTSCGLTMNENCEFTTCGARLSEVANFGFHAGDSDVRKDMSDALDKLVPEDKGQ